MLAQHPAVADTLCEVAGRRVRVHQTDSHAELQHVAQHLAATGTDLVLLAGGDGSLMAGVTALWRAFPEGEVPALSPIPAGTAGTIARNWGIAGQPERCLARVLDEPRRLVPRASLHVLERRVGEANSRIGFIVGTGLVARFFRHYYDRGAPGYAGSAKLVARIFLESFVGGPLAKDVLTPLPCQLTIEGSVCAPRAWSLICCSVVPNLGIHMLVNYRAGEDRTRPHLVATPMPPQQLGPRAPWVLAGKPFGGPGHVDRLAARFTIVFPGPNEGPYVLDGELLSATSLEVTAGPVLTIATPP